MDSPEPDEGHDLDRPESNASDNSLPSGQWIQWDFRDREVRLSHYAIQSPSTGILEEWGLAGSENGRDWSLIDVQIPLTDWFRDGKSMVFFVNGRRTVRFLRLIVANEPGVRSRLAMRAVEFFGELIMDRRVVHTATPRTFPDPEADRFVCCGPGSDSEVYDDDQDQDQDDFDWDDDDDDGYYDCYGYDEYAMYGWDSSDSD
jgi:hypothetical protein